MAKDDIQKIREALERKDEPVDDYHFFDVTGHFPGQGVRGTEEEPGPMTGQKLAGGMHNLITSPPQPTPPPTLNWNQVEKEIRRHAKFDDIAAIAVYLHADVAREKGAMSAAKNIINTLKRSTSLQGLASLTVETLIDKLDWADLYNDTIKGILEYRNLKWGVDNWGALYYRDVNGQMHEGDQSGFFPLFLSEAELMRSINAK